jgi:hypothetical protein
MELPAELSPLGYTPLRTAFTSGGEARQLSVRSPSDLLQPQCTRARSADTFVDAAPSEAEQLDWLEALTEHIRAYWLQGESSREGQKPLRLAHCFRAMAEARASSSNAGPTSPTSVSHDSPVASRSPFSRARASLRPGLGPRPEELAALAASPARSDAAALLACDVVQDAVDSQTAELVSLNALWRDVVTAKDACLAEAAVNADRLAADLAAERELVRACKSQVRTAEDAATAQRMRAEIALLAAEDERARLLAALWRKEASVRHFQGLARRAFAQLNALEAAQAASVPHRSTQAEGRSRDVRLSHWRGGSRRDG